MKIISRRKNSKEEKLKNHMEEKNLHPELKKMRIKDLQGNFSKKIERNEKYFNEKKNQKRKIEQKWWNFFLLSDLKKLRKNFASKNI